MRAKPHARLEHRRDFLNGKDDSALFKHKQNDHSHEDMKYRMEITKQFCDPLTRQANEAVRIGSKRKNEILNGKNKFNHPPIARITVEGRKKKIFSQNKSAKLVLKIVRYWYIQLLFWYRTKT